MEANDNAPIKSDYTELETFREPYVTRARRAAELTVPSLFPPANYNGSTPLPQPYQSLGARGINNLAARLLLVSVPVDQPFLKLTVDEKEVPEIEGQPDLKQELERALSKIIDRMMDRVSTSNARSCLFEALKQWLVAGNVLVYLANDYRMRMFRLDRYVVQRDPMGTVLKIIIKESVSPLTLDSTTRAACACDGEKVDKTVDVYTEVLRTSTNWTVRQEINGHIVPDSIGTYPLDACPYIVLRYTSVDGEDYGRGFVEEYYGDLNSLEELSKAIVQGAAAMAKLLVFVRPGAAVRVKDIEDAPNGGILSGDVSDVGLLQLQKFGDFRVAREQVERISNDLGKAFMLQSSAQRKGERVTAEEIRLVASELEDSYGGVYSLLSQDLQLPLGRRYMVIMAKKQEIPALPKSVKPVVVTGMSALGRDHAATKIDNFLVRAAQVLGPNAVVNEVNPSRYMKVQALNQGVKLEDIVFTDEEKAANERNAQIAAMMAQAAPQATKGIFDGINQAAADNRQPPETA